MLPLPENKGIDTPRKYAEACIGMCLDDVIFHFEMEMVKYRIVCRDGKPDPSIMPENGVVDIEVNGDYVVAAQVMPDENVRQGAMGWSTSPNPRTYYDTPQAPLPEKQREFWARVVGYFDTPAPEDQK